MKRNKTLLFALICLSISALAQKNVVGTVLDTESRFPLIGVSIIEEGTQNGCSTDVDGNFSIKLSDGNKHLIISYVGYEKKVVQTGNKSNLGTISLAPKELKLNDVTVTAQLAIPRMTPVAASTVYASEIDERLGNNEFIEVLKTTPGVHVNRVGGGWADSEIFMRGFDNSNVAVMINGIPVNDMENGSLYWSNWAS